jgi:hypothetical protein
MPLKGTPDEQFTQFLTACGVTAGPNPDQLNPSTALAFWLGGPLIDGQPRGFHSDPANPFKLGEPRTKPYFDFDKNRLVGYRFFPAKIQPASPYVYFRAVRDKTTGFYEYGAVYAGKFHPYQVGLENNICVPYLEDACNVPDSPLNPDDATLPARIWRAPETYQILSAGLDGVYSTYDGADPAPFRVSRLGVGFSNGDYDNLASFAEGELEAEL